MSTFKELYRKRRDAGLRGQGEKTPTAVRNKELSKPPSRRPRGLRRRIYRAMKPILPTHDPKESNHLRMLRRKEERKAKETK